ncbi:MAG: hypothetical protein Q8Q37_01370 [bacterium]|nr:hypothetical protein [bacterium]
MALDTQFIKKSEERLKELLNEISDELRSMKSTPEMGSDVDSFDTETDETEELGNELGIKDVLKKRLSAVEKSLDKIKDGSYGTCENCRKEISKDILEVDPESEFCQECKKD